MTLRTLFYTLLLACLPTLLSAQKIERFDPMKMWPYSYEGVKLNRRALTDILVTEPSAAAEVQKTKTPLFFATVTAGVGGFLVGQQLGLALNPNRSATDTGKIVGYAGGGALIIFGLLLEAGTTKRLHRAVKNYNTVQEEGAMGSTAKKSYMNVGTTANGVGVTLSF